MKKIYCVAPEAIFYNLLEEAGKFQQFWALKAGKLEDNPENRHEIYLEVVDTLRKQGQLCTHPDHQPKEFKLN